MFSLVTTRELPMLGLLPEDTLLRTVAGALVSARVAALLTGTSIERVRRLVDEGALPAAGKRHRRIRLADLAGWRGRDFTAADWRRVTRRCDGTA